MSKPNPYLGALARIGALEADLARIEQRHGDADASLADRVVELEAQLVADGIEWSQRVRELQAQIDERDATIRALVERRNVPA